MKASVGAVRDATFRAVLIDKSEPVVVFGFSVFGLGMDDLVLHEAESVGEHGWRVSDAVTGCALSRLTWDSREAALEALDAMFAQRGPSMKLQIEGRRVAVMAARNA
jgi:hypothetical protein